MVHRWFCIIFVFILPATCFAQVRRLDFYLQQGLVNSPLMKDFSNQVRSNNLDSLIIHATRVPQVNFNGLLSYAPVINGYGYSEAVTNIGNFNSVVSVTQPLFNRKTVEAQYSKIGLQNRSLANTAGISARDLKKTITAQYLTACSVFSDISFNLVVMKQAREEEKLLNSLVKSGLYRQTDYLSFLLELQTLEFQQNDLQTQYQRTLSDLNLLCGINDTTTYEPELPDLSGHKTGGTTGSLFFERFSVDSLRISNDLLISERGYKPRVAWYSDAGLVNNDPALIYKNLGFSFGVTFSLPVFDGNQRKLNVEKLKTAEDTRRNYRDFFLVQYLQQRRQLNQALKQTGGLIPRLGSQLELAGSIVRQDKQLLATGGISITDYIIALKNYIAIQSNLNQYRIRVLQIMNEINYWKD